MPAPPLPGPLSWLGSVRPGQELAPGIVVERAFRRRDRVKFSISGRLLTLEVPVGGRKYHSVVDGLGVNIDSPWDAKAKAVSDAFVKQLKAQRAELQVEPDPRQVRDQATAASLFLVPGHIGDPLDISVRAIETLASSGLILVEDEAESAIALLEYHGVVGIEVATMDGDAEGKIQKTLDQGLDVAIFGGWEGTPGFCDPGTEFISGLDVPVRALGGTSVLATALMRVPVHVDRFTFCGAVHQDKDLDCVSGEWRRGTLPIVLFTQGYVLESVWKALIRGGQPVGDVHLLACLTREDEWVVTMPFSRTAEIDLDPNDPIVLIVERQGSAPPPWWRRILQLFRLLPERRGKDE